MAAWRSKEIIMDHIQGSESSSFQVIPAFCDALKSLDRGAYAEWETYPGTRKSTEKTRKTGHGFYDWFKEVLQRISATNKECGDYIASIAPNTYAAYAVPQPRFGHTTSNLVEVGNSCILPLRSYAPFKLCFQMYIYLMELKAKRQRQASAMESRFTPFATDLLQKNEEAAGAYRVRMAFANQALVQSNRQDFIVTTFPDVSCSCLGFKDMLLPCIHILAVERESRRNSDRLVGRVWTVDALCAAHTLTLSPILAQELKQDLHCMAPPAAVKKGRRRVRRILGPGECSQNALRNSHQSSREESSLISVPVNDTSTNLEGLLQEPPSKKARLCSLCRGSGHDRRNCHSKQASWVTFWLFAPLVLPISLLSLCFSSVVIVSML
ncbi:hypothetical protein R1sor_013324 [Riccia sorocarpa]|uniref:SWIM-type domain-containing protein n=1 Tax=Riccia sorocarpa TaxID=122646 RepID=A0ABD3H681_9MARC